MKIGLPTATEPSQSPSRPGRGGWCGTPTRRTPTSACPRRGAVPTANGTEVPSRADYERRSTLGLPADARDYGTGAQILVDLGIRTMRLLTNNPTKRAGLEGYGLEIVGRQSLPVHATKENLRYLKTKRDRMGHDLPGLAAFEDEATEASASAVDDVP